MRSASNAKEVLGCVGRAELAAPILPRDDPRWGRLCIREVPDVGLRDRFRGALIGGAIGDAMGRPNEGVWPTEIRARRIRDYEPWHGWRKGPKGTVTDDTQMTLWLAESILASAGTAGEAGGGDVRDGLLDPDDLAKRFTLVFARRASKNQTGGTINSSHGASEQSDQGHA